MPGVGWSKPKPYHWRVIFRPWLDLWRRMTGGSTTRDWHEWVTRQSVGSGLHGEVSDFYWSHIRAGVHPSIAAYWALEEWDI
jgi:hypothetical protein